MGQVIILCTAILIGVAKILSTVLDIIDRVNKKTESEVRNAEHIIIKANKPETTGKYITATRESKNLEDERWKIRKQMEQSDLDAADEYLNTFL